MRGRANSARTIRLYRQGVEAHAIPTLGPDSMATIAVAVEGANFVPATGIAPTLCTGAYCTKTPVVATFLAR
jgi:hypothetical protein